MRPKKEISKSTDPRSPSRKSTATTPEYTEYAPQDGESVIGVGAEPPAQGEGGGRPHTSPWGPASRTAKKP